MMFEFVKDTEPIYKTEEFDVILLGVSTHNMLMGNFQAKIGVKYPLIEEVNNSTPYGDLRKLGKRITIDDLGEGKPIISLMYICTYPTVKKEYLDYKALERCLRTANSEFKGKRIMTTVLGSSNFDGRGNREKCLKIMEETLKDVNVTIFDYEQIKIKDEIKRQNRYFTALRKKHKGDKEMLSKITEMQYEMREKTFLPTKTYLSLKRREEDDILNF